MKLTATHITLATKAAGAGSGMVATPQAIADLFNEAIEKYGDGRFTTVNTYAALVSECMMESAYFRTTREYSNSGAYQPYRGRTFIQLTWRANYEKFGAWCKSVGLVSDADYFVKNPSKLEDLKWAALGGVWYFTKVPFSGKPLTAYADNMLQVGRAVNMGSPFSKNTPNGQKARDAAYIAVVKALKADPEPKPAPTTPETPVALSQTKRKEWKNSGKYVDERTHAQLEAVEEILGKPIVMYQGSWSNGTLSADTHAGAGAADIGPTGGVSWRDLETACRKVGLAAWFRNWKGNLHVHVLSIGNSKMASWAKVQVAAYKAGYDGLGPKARSGKDTGNRSYVNVTWEKVDQEYGMPSAQEIAKAFVEVLVKDDDLCERFAIALFSADIFPNQWTGNKDGNPTVSGLTMFDRLGSRTEVIQNAVAPSAPPSEPEVKPSAPTT